LAVLISEVINPKTSTMNWYLTKLVYQIICGDGNHTPQFDEQLRLISADGKQDAFLKAKEIGLAGEEFIQNTKQQSVQWKFINISELYKINGWIHGAELYSRVNEADDADSYIAFTNQKAADIELGFTHEMLKLL
jgi:hypothetical protein